MPKKVTEARLYKAIVDHHPTGAWAVFSQVRNSTGFANKLRTADALAMSLWPSRGLELHGFEIKVSRSDWLREAKDPAKADEIAQFCDRWWVVTAQDVVDPTEIPPAWGLMVLERGRLKVSKKAKKTLSKPMSREMLAALLRRAAAGQEKHMKSYILKEEVEDKIRDAEKRGVRAAAPFELKSRITDLERNIARFEKASGVSLSPEWKMGDIGKAVKFVTEAVNIHDPEPLDAVKKALKVTATRARNLAKNIDSVIAKDNSKPVSLSLFQ